MSHNRWNTFVRAGCRLVNGEFVWFPSSRSPSLCADTEGACYIISGSQGARSSNNNGSSAVMWKFILWSIIGYHRTWYSIRWVGEGWILQGQGRQACWGRMEYRGESIEQPPGSRQTECKCPFCLELCELRKLDHLTCPCLHYGCDYSTYRTFITYVSIILGPAYLLFASDTAPVPESLKS